MLEPPHTAPHTQQLVELRERAALRLRGAAATKGSVASVANALSVLHAMASRPETAADALTLLHEMQVHQVEVDLQAQDLRESRVELEAELRRQIQLYDHQPVGCFTTDPQSVLLALNHSGAAMLGMAHDDALGLPLEAFFDADGARRLRLALADLVTPPAQPSIVLKLCPRNAPARRVQASIGRDPGSKGCIVNLMYAGGPAEPR